MAIFEHNGKKFNVADEYIDVFAEEYPDAITYDERYHIRAKNYKAYLNSTKSQTEAEQPTVEQPTIPSPELQPQPLTQQKIQPQSIIQPMVEQPTTSQGRENYFMQSPTSGGNMVWDADERRFVANQEGLQGRYRPKPTEVVFNPQTKRIEQQYITPAGNVTTDKAAADFESQQWRNEYDVSLSGRLDRANAELKELEEQLRARRDALLERNRENQTSSGIMSFAQGLRSAEMGGQINIPGMDDVINDSEYKTLFAAVRQKKDQIQMLQNKIAADSDSGLWGDTKRFFRHFGQAVADIDSWDFGISQLGDMSQMLRINNKIERGEELTKAEQTLMENLLLTQSMEQQIGDLGDAATWGNIGGTSLSLMTDFILTGGYSGVAKGLTKRAATAIARKGTNKLATELAEEGLWKYATKNGIKGVRNQMSGLVAEQGLGRTASMLATRTVGVTAEDLLIRAPLMATTIQGGRLAGDIIDTKLGPVEVDEVNGELRFANDHTWGEAAWEATADRVIENMSEMAGGHFLGVDDVTKAFGANAIVSRFLRATPQGIKNAYAKTSQFLQKAGVQSITGEVAEEYVGQLWRTGLGLESASQPVFDANGNPVYETDSEGNILKDENGEPIQKRENNLLSGEFHKDIWCGMALSVGLTQYSGTALNYGTDKAIGAIAQARQRHNLKIASTKAGELFGTDVWESMRAIIDTSENEAVADYAEQIINDDEMTDEQQSAVLNYMEQTLVMRGINLGALTANRIGMRNVQERRFGRSWGHGYEAVNAEERSDIQAMYDYQRQCVLDYFGGKQEIIDDLDNDPVGAITDRVGQDKETQQIVADYINSKMVYDGMMQRAKDEIDERITQSNAMIDSRTNPTTGMVLGATMKQDDRKVYVVSGNVAMHPDGSGVDTTSSDDSIVIKDAETGKTEMVSPNMILNVDEPLDANEQKAIAAENIRTEIETMIDSQLRGLLNFTAGEVYEVAQEDGSVVAMTAIANEQGVIDNGDGTINVQFADGSVGTMNKDVLQASADTKRKQRVVDMARQIEEERKAKVNSTEVAEEEPTDDISNENPLRSKVKYSQQRRVELLDENGNVVSGRIALASEDGYTIDLDGDYAINNDRSPVFSEEELTERLVSYDGKAVNKENRVGESGSRLEQKTDNQGNPINEEGKLLVEGVSSINEISDDDFVRPTRNIQLPPIPQNIDTAIGGNGKPIVIKKNVFEKNARKHKELTAEDSRRILQQTLYDAHLYGQNQKTSRPYNWILIHLADKNSAIIVEVSNNKDNVEIVNWHYLSDEALDRKQRQAEREGGLILTLESAAANTSNDLSFQMKETAEPTNSRTGVDSNLDGKSDDTATRQDTVASSDGKDSQNSETTQEIKPSALDRVPKDAQGNPMYTQTDAETAWDAIVEEAEGDTEIAAAAVNSMVADMQSALKKAEKAKSKGGVTMKEKMDAERERKAAINAARQQLEAWQAIVAVPTSRQQAAEAEQKRIEEERLQAERAAEQQRKAEEAERAELERQANVNKHFAREYDKMGEPTSFYEFVLRAISGGLKFKWGDKDNKTKGLGSHLGYNSEAERRARLWMLDNEKGLFPEVAAQRLLEDYNVQTGRGAEMDDMEALGVILDVLSSHTTAKSMYNEVVSLQQKAQREYEEYLRSEYDAFCQQNFHISAEEYEAYEETVREDIKAKELSEEQYQEYNNIVAENALEEERRRQNEINQRNEQSGIDDLRTRGDDVLHGKETVSRGRNRESETERRTGIDVGSNSTDATLPQGTSGRTDVNNLLSDELDENGHPFVVSSDGTTIFGEITDDTGLPSAPIKLSEGIVDENGNGYGLQHIEARHGEQIRDAGFKSVEDFVKYVAENYDKDNIKVGKKRVNGSGTFIIQIEDEHSNLLYIELSRDGSYWNVNSGGVFRKGYSGKRKNVEPNTEHSTSDTASSDKSFVQTNSVNGSKLADTHSDNQRFSDSKDTTNSPTDNAQGEENTDNRDIKQIINQAEENNSPVRYDAKSATWHNAPGKWFTSKKGRFGEIKAWGEHNSISLYYDEHGTSSVRVYINNFDSETIPDSVIDDIEKHNFDIIINGESVPHVEFKTYAAARIFADYLDTLRQQNAVSSVQQQVETAEAEVNTNPTDKQKEAGNYKKDHVQIGTFNVTIEQPKGSVRSGVDKGGKKWEIEMQNTYGYIRGTEGVDGDHIDVFLSDDIDGWNGRQVYVVDQRNEDGSFDEHKVMLGFNDINDAEAAYLSNYKKGWRGLGAITGVAIEDFEKWIASSHRKTKAFAEYKTVKTTEGQSSSHDTDQVSDQVSDAPYSIAPAQYTTKKGKVLDMFLVKFPFELSRAGQRTASAYAKAEKGWYDSKQGGFMMRSEESAKQFAEHVSYMHLNLITSDDLKAVSNGDVVFTEPKEEKKDGPIWQYTVSVDRQTGSTALRREDVSGVIPIGDGRWTKYADSPEEMLAILQNPLNHMEDILAEVGGTLHNMIVTREVDRKNREERERKQAELRENGVNGYKIGDEVIYKGKKATIIDFETYGEHLPVLDTGMGPVIYEVVEWSEIEKPQQNQSASSLKGQDLTTGFSIDNDAETSAKVIISKQGAKHELNKLIHKYAGVRKTRGFISDLAIALGDRSEHPKQTYYFEFRDNSGNSYTLRISNHNVNGENAKLDEKEISIVVKSRRQPNKFIPGNADVVEYVYFKESIANGDGHTLSWIVQDIATMLDTGKYMDNSGVAVVNESPKSKSTPKPKAKPQPKNEGQFGLVSDERMAYLKERLRKKLGGQMNIGIDPEILAIGLEVAIGHLDRGVKSFTDFAKVMIDDLGDVIRPYLKAFYNGARELPEVTDNGLASDMTPYSEVRTFDVANFDKQQVNSIATAETVVREAEVEQEVEIAQQRIKKSRSTRKQSEKKAVTLQGQTGGLFDEQFTETDNADTELHRKFAMTVKADMLAALDSGAKPYRSIVDIRKRASEIGIEVDNDGRTDILLQELVEDGLVRAAREVVAQNGRATKESFDLVRELYDMQPTIAARSSNRIKMQQYSTPLPMAWIANRFAMETKEDGKVLEPTAGNGMLVFTVPANQVHANELDETRLANLREQGFARVTQQDATEPFEGGKQYDVVIANPPFGKRDAVDYDGKPISGLDPQITLNALASMKDNGRAAIIIGGNMEYARNGAIKNMKPFFTYLYDHYNVKGVIDMSGGLYAKQGTTFPTRMILIDGRRSEEEREQTAIYPPIESKAIRKAESFDDLYEILNEILTSNKKTNGTEILRSQGRRPLSVADDTSGNTDGERHNQQSPKNDDIGSRARGRGTELGSHIETGERPLLGQRGQNDTVSATGRRTDSVGEPRDVGGRSGQRTLGNGSQSVDGLEIQRNGLGLKQEPKKRELSEEKLPYRPHNTAFSLESVAPAAMAEAMDRVLTQIEEQHGSIDEFIKNELGYASIEEAHQALAAEQMDSVAMAIYQMKQGQALIIGDQTGVGKGRQMAALIRWAVNRGEKPVFITQKADLFSDIYRDLVDIGSGDLVPFIFNSPSAKENKGEMVDANGKVVYKGLSDAKMKKVMASGVLPDEYDYVVLTYSQVNTGDEVSQNEAKEAAKKSGKRIKKSKSAEENKPTPKATFLRAIAADNYLFLDESHTAAGTGNTGAYLQSILRNAKAATFASATFAKRPDTMPLYVIRTAMSQAKIEPDKMIGIIEKGGVTLQEIMSRELTNAGQMVRRERDMSDVKTDWKTIDDVQTVKRARENYDKTITAFNAIIKFQEDYVKPKIAEVDEILAERAESANIKRGTNKLGVENVSFASKTYNYTKQLMLALKVDAIANEVEAEIKAGRHPVIALESTMESTIKDYAIGSVIEEPTFSASLLKGLESVMQYTVKDENGKETNQRYTPKSLGEAGERAYYELQDFIRQSTADVFISPLDAIIERLHEKGFKVGELTGRDMYVERDNNGRVVVRRRTDKDKKRMQREFNNGTLDVLILNKSASTGISLHASNKFSDQRQRSMIIAQPLSDINDYMQMIGRIDRTGQVHRGYYINLGLPVPAENRFLMMLSTKLKSLNANTTTSQDNESNEVEAPDLLNKYGSQVIVEYLRDNAEIYEKMGSPLKDGKGQISSSQLDDYKAQEEDARKITGYAALLTTSEQEDFYDDVVRRYNELIKYLNDTGNNDLKITVMPLRAKTIEKRVSSEGIDPTGNNPFARNSYVEKVEMDVLRKPMKADEIRKVIAQVNKGKDAAAYMNDVLATIDREFEAKVQAEEERYEKAKVKATENITKQTDKINYQQKRTEAEKADAIARFTDETNAMVEAKHEDNISRLHNVNSQLVRHLGMFEVGKSYFMPDNLESMVFDFATPAIFCGYKTKESKITASTTLAVFATLDGRRRVEIKLSQTEALQSIDRMTNNNWDTARSMTLDNWDSQIPNETRKTGFIMTGNILQAIADTQDEHGGYPGQLISYTDIDGNVRDGILMPDKWNSSMLKSNGSPLSSRLQQIKEYNPIISLDGKVEIIGSRWSKEFYLTVPKTKKNGAVFFENKKLLDAANGNGFYPYRGKLRADIPEDRITEVVKELTKLGVKVKENHDVVEDDVLYRTSETPLNPDDVVNVEHTDPHDFNNFDEAKQWAKENIVRTYSNEETAGKGEIRISNNAVSKYLSESAVEKSDDKDVHLSVLKVLPSVIRSSVDAEQHPDYNKGEDGKRRPENGINEDVNIHRLYGAVELNGEVYRVKITIKEDFSSNEAKAPHSYEATKIELLAGTLVKPESGPNPNTNNSISLAKLLNNVDKSYRPGEKLLDESNLRQGNGALSDAELSMANDPAARVLGSSPRSRKQQSRFAERMRGYMRDKVRQLSKRLNVEIEIVEDSSTLSGKRAKSKGFFDKKTGKVTVVLPNNTSIADIEETVLHETVAHYGLRKLFGDQFDVFLEKVFDNANESIRRQIVALASKYKWDFRKATEEYLATLAEDKNIYGNKIARWLETIRRLFLNMLQRFGFKYSGAKLNLNDLRYVLWASYQNLQGAMPLYKEAADIAKRFELGVGEFAVSGNRSAVKAANERFNKELDDFKNKKHEGLLHLGRPGAILSAAGVNAKELTLSPKVLNRKMEQHNLITDDLKGLAAAIQSPILVYRHGEKIPNLVVVTELNVRGGKLSVALKLDENGNIVEVSNVSSVHSKDAATELSRLIKLGNDALADGLRWVEKEKVLDWLGIADLNRPIHTNNPKLDSVAKIIENFENPKTEDEILFRDGDPVVQERALARDRYEKRMRSQFFQSQEALQDSMLSLKEAMKLILGKKWKSVEDVHGHENAYLGENRLSSVNKAEADAFGRLLFKPLLDAVAKLAPNRDARTELTDYMFAKHGLERNRVMAEKYTQQAIDDGDVRPYAEIYAEYRKRDYAGLTALTGLADVAAAEAEAQQMVDEYEAKHDTKELWKRINRVSNAILEKSFESGLICEETYKKISDMYEFYIPLRGFDEKTSEDAYTYLTHKDSAFNAPIIVTRGRKSIADDPLAYLQSMAESTIMQGNRNMLVKQRFLNFVLHHPSDLVSVSELWVEYDEVRNEWKPVFPDNIGANDSAEEVQRKMQDFETKMEELRRQDPKRYKKGSDAANVPYRIVRKEHLNEHQIIVKRGGRDVILTINGNPRLAQALNGLTNPDNDLKNSLEIIAKGANYVNRQLSLFYTSRNPDFIVSNFLRDMLYTNTMVWVKESPNYALRFHKNVGKANIVQMRILYAKYRNNKLNMNNDMEKMFYQFMMNGGETGYTNVKDIEQRKKDIQKLIRQAAGKLPIGTALNLLDEQFDELNRAVENSARFAAFMTSREMSRTIDRAIYDAKEISVNFNKKGSGDRMLESNRGLGKASSVVSWIGRSAYVFWNAAIQGTTNFGRQVKRHPLKALATVATYFLLGMIIAALGDDDDEDNSYYNIPDYIRRSNILFRTGDSWVSIPLPIEFRSVYGMGELAMSTLSGKERHSDGELAWKIAGQMSQILPLDFLEGGGGWHAFVPSIAKPAVEAQANTSWTGLPIYKETPFNKNMPNWTKAYSTSNRYIVNLTKALNEASGGDAYTKGSVDLNPAKIEYMLNGYFSGLTGTVDKLVKMGETAFGGREYDPRNFLLLNRVVKNGDERTEIKAVNNSYWELKKEYDELKKRLKNYEKDTDNGVFNYAEKIDFIHNSPEYARYLIFDEYRRDINDLTEQLDEAKENNDEEAYQEIEIKLNEKKKELVTRAGETYK